MAASRNSGPFGIKGSGPIDLFKERGDKAAGSWRNQSLEPSFAHFHTVVHLIAGLVMTSIIALFKIGFNFSRCKDLKRDFVCAF